jgi:hypothetical protein
MRCDSELMERETGLETAPQPWRAALYQLSYSRAFPSLPARRIETSESRGLAPAATGNVRPINDDPAHQSAVLWLVFYDQRRRHSFEPNVGFCQTSACKDLQELFDAAPALSETWRQRVLTIGTGGMYVPQAVGTEFQLDFSPGRPCPFGEGDDLRILLEPARCARALNTPGRLLRFAPRSTEFYAPKLSDG